MAAARSSAPNYLICTASLATVSLLVDLLLLAGPLDGGLPALLIVLKYPLALALTAGVVAAGRVIRRAEAACLEDLHD